MKHSSLFPPPRLERRLRRILLGFLLRVAFTDCDVLVANEDGAGEDLAVIGTDLGEGLIRRRDAGLNLARNICPSLVRKGFPGEAFEGLIAWGAPKIWAYIRQEDPVSQHIGKRAVSRILTQPIEVIQEQINAWLTEYNTEWPHEGIGNMTPIRKLVTWKFQHLPKERQAYTLCGQMLWRGTFPSTIIIFLLS